MRLFKKRIVDERVESERVAHMPIAYLIQQVVAILLIASILIKGYKLIYLIPSIVSIVGVTLFVVVKCMLNGIAITDILNPKDEFIKNFRNKFLQTGFLSYAGLVTILAFVGIIDVGITGNMLGVLNIVFINSVIILIIPSSYLTISYVSKGLIVNNNVSLRVTDKKKSLRKFRLNCLYGLVSYVVVIAIMNRPDSMQAWLIKIILPSSIFIITYYPLMRFMIKRSERNANNREKEEELDSLEEINRK